MRLTAKHKVYGGVIGLCAVAFMLDRTFLAPSTAAAGVATSETTVAVADMAEPARPPAATSRSNIAGRFESAAAARGLELATFPDAFRPASGWGPIVEGTTLGADAVRLFRQEHSLAAVMDGDQGGAVVDGRVLLIGQTLDGFTLTAVTEATAVFEAGATRVSLVIPGREDG